MASPRRPYVSRIRDDQTRLTRRRILGAAAALLLERGYLGTTVDAIAGAAEVSVQTVYNVVGGKASVLKAVYDVTLAGDDEPVPIGDRPGFRAMLTETDPRRCMAHYAGLARELGERTLPLVAMLLAQAATGEKDLRAFAETIESERAIGTAAFAGHVADRFGLRPGLDVDDAAAVVWTLTSPDVADRLVRRRGWGWQRYADWLGTTLADALLGPAGRS